MSLADRSCFEGTHFLFLYLVNQFQTIDFNGSQSAIFSDFASLKTLKYDSGKNYGGYYPTPRPADESMIGISAV